MDNLILVVEDEPAIQVLVSAILKHEKFNVRCVSTAEEAEKHIHDVLPMLLIVDWMLPGQSGIAFIKNIRSSERTKDLPVIMLTARAHEDDRVQGLESGADDYVAKPFSSRELVARVKALLRRRTPHLSDETVVIGTLSLNPATYQVMSAGRSVELGPTEFRLLHFFMTHPGRVFSRIELLDAVWGDHVFIEERTVDVHIRRLRAALACAGADKYLETVRGAGYCFRREATE